MLPVFLMCLFILYVVVWWCAVVMITGLGVLSPHRKHICSKSHSIRKQTPHLPLTRCIMSLLGPIDQMTITVEVDTESTSESLGPGTHWDSNSQTFTQLQSRTEAPAHYPCTERGEWTTHKALTETHALGERQIEMRGREERKGRLSRGGLWKRRARRGGCWILE